MGDWIEWKGGPVPVEGTEARGWLQFSHETREQAMGRIPTFLDNWPWFDDEGQPIVVAYRVVPPTAQDAGEGVAHPTSGGMG